MKKLGIVFLFVSFCILLALGIAQVTGLSLMSAAGISVVACLLIYLMMDLRPDAKAGEATLVRLRKSSWHRKKP